MFAAEPMKATNVISIEQLLDVLSHSINLQLMLACILIAIDCIQYRKGSLESEMKGGNLLNELQVADCLFIRISHNCLFAQQLSNGQQLHNRDFKLPEGMKSLSL
jgi:hypothetical protein